MIERLLIANRGEIAVRIIRTCRALGISAVAIYSDADAYARHVADADIAVRIGPAPAAQSYLDMQAVLDAARRTEADAVHPGYGFLAENPEFAEAVIGAGLTWVGPPPAAMRALGDKARARALAQEHGVPVLPGYHGEHQSPDTLRAHAARIGFPVLIKAAAGGGGRGMRVVESASAFDEHLAAARREARAAFGDERVLLERYVSRPRHVEVQVFGDAHGNVVHLGERECSVQRRHQKLIEESPSPAVTPALRERMGEAALRLVRAAGYQNAGTVEFLLLPDGEFAFLEVNARLQVEHPVTEAVTGLDLVEQQLRVAAGEPLLVRQSDVRLDGYAIEARVVAEDPLGGWTPSSGRIAQVSFAPGVRVDTWIADGSVVPQHYDSLLAKVIGHAASRADALATLADALAETRIEGVADNLDLLLATIEHPAFIAGDLHTGFLDQHGLVEATAELPLPVLAAASTITRAAADPWRATNSWRVARVDAPVEWLRASRRHAARVADDLVSGDLVVSSGDGDAVAARQIGSDRVRVEGCTLTVRNRAAWRVVIFENRHYRVRHAPPLEVEQMAHSGGGAAGGLSAPMPARVVRVAVAAGDAVAQNQALVVLEAMKMEHVVEAPHAGVVAEVCVAVGDQVAAGAQLIVLSATRG